MTEEIPERYGVQLAAVRSQANRMIGFGAVLLALAAVMLPGGTNLFVILFGIGGAFLAWMGVQLRWSGGEMMVVRRASHAVTLGDVEGAELLHRVAERGGRLRAPLRRSIELQRARLAIRRGDISSALGHAEACLALPVGWLEGDQARVERSHALALRAFARAVRGEAELAQADVDSVQAAECTSAEALALVALAEAVTLHREDRRADLRAHLREHRTLLAGHTSARERTLVRGLERSLSVDPESVEADLARAGSLTGDDWLARIAPDVASFARAPFPAASPSAVPVDESRAAQGRTRRDAVAASGSRLGCIAGLLGLVLLALFVGLYQLVVWSDSGPPVAEAPLPPARVSLSDVWPVGLAAAVFVLSFAFFRRRLRSRGTLDDGRVRWARGDVTGARAVFERLRRSRAALLAASAEQQLAAMAFQEGDAERARALVDGALGRLTGNLKTMASDLLYPSLLEDHAVLTASAGDIADATAEFRMLRTELPTYPLAERANRRVRLMIAVQSGDYETAARIADVSADVTLSAREDLLIDVASAVVGAAGRTPGEIDRLRALLEPPSDEREWLEAIAPDLLDAFDGPADADEPA